MRNAVNSAATPLLKLDSFSHATGNSLAPSPISPEQIEAIQQNILKRIQDDIDDRINQALREKLRQISQMQAQMASQISNILQKLDTNAQK